MKLESRMDYSVVPTGTASVVHVLLTLTAPTPRRTGKGQRSISQPS